MRSNGIFFVDDDDAAGGRKNQRIMPTDTTTSTDSTTPISSLKTHPYIHTAKLLQGLTGINLTPNENEHDYRARISSLSHLGDPPEGTRSDIKSLSKVLNLHVGDVLVKINEMSLYQIPFSDVVLLSKRQGAECVLTVASDRRQTIGTTETNRTTTTTTLKEPRTTKYRITKSYGYMQFDFKEFSEFFEGGSDSPLKSLRADWNRAKYFLNGQRTDDMDLWVEKCCEGREDRGKSDGMVLRMCKYRSMAKRRSSETND